MQVVVRLLTLEEERRMNAPVLAHQAASLVAVLTLGASRLLCRPEQVPVPEAIARHLF